MQILEALAYLATILGLPCGIWVLWHSIKTYESATRLSHYATFDAMYSDLLKLAIDRPNLRNPATLQKSEEGQYEIYAHLAWCLVETLYDHGRHDRWLFKTWSSAIAIENDLHRAWLGKPENRMKFKSEFVKWVEEKGWEVTR